MMRELLRIADIVRRDARTVTAEDVDRARRSGADDQAIHDTVLITGMFEMFNCYVDGLATLTPDDPAIYEEIGGRIAANGYGSRPYPDETAREDAERHQGIAPVERKAVE